MGRVLKWPVIVVGMIVAVWFMFAYPLQAIILTLLWITFGPGLLEQANARWLKRIRLTNLSNYLDAPPTEPRPVISPVTRGLFVTMIILTTVCTLVTILHG